MSFLIKNLFLLFFIFFLNTFLLNIFTPTLSLAVVDYTPLVSDVQMGSESLKTQQGFPVFLDSLFQIGVAIAVILAVIMVVIGGIEYMVTDSPFGKGDAKGRIGAAIGGLVLALSTILIFNEINPDIATTNLEVPKVIRDNWGVFNYVGDPGLFVSQEAKLAQVFLSSKKEVLGYDMNGNGKLDDNEKVKNNPSTAQLNSFNQTGVVAEQTINSMGQVRGPASNATLSGHTFTVNELTAYFPGSIAQAEAAGLSGAVEGGIYDGYSNVIMGNTTIEDYRAGKGPGYVTVAMDNQANINGNKLQGQYAISNSFPGVVFRVMDSGGHGNGKTNTGWMDIATSNPIKAGATGSGGFRVTDGVNFTVISESLAKQIAGSRTNY